MIVPPQNFGFVEPDLYRSSQPTELNFPFLEKLRLRTAIYLAPDEPPAPLLAWFEDQRINLVHLGEDVGKRSPWKPISEETVLEGLHVMLDPASYPLIVMCNLGRHRTGTLVGCLRKLQGWNLTAILEEYRRHAGPKFRLLNEQFIELFDCDLVAVPPPERRPPWLLPQQREAESPASAAASGGDAVPSAKPRSSSTAAGLDGAPVQELRATL